MGQTLWLDLAILIYLCIFTYKVWRLEQYVNRVQMYSAQWSDESLQKSKVYTDGLHNNLTKLVYDLENLNSKNVGWIDQEILQLTEEVEFLIKNKRKKNG